MEEMKIDVLQVQKKDIPRETDNWYWQPISYEHLWKEVENGLTENIFIVTIGDQFFNPTTRKSFVNGIEVHFRLTTKEKILHNYRDPKARHPEAVSCIAAMTFEAIKMLREDTLRSFDKSQFNNLELPNFTQQLVLEIVTKSLPR